MALSCSAFAVGGACPASVPADITNCYYFDFVGGSDSNSGTTEAAPWKNPPGSQLVVNNVGPGNIDDAAGDKCGSTICDYSHTGFIFKGGVSWTQTVWPMTMRLKGTGLSSRVYWGVDPLWFTGGSWTRPILNYGGSAQTNCNQNNVASNPPPCVPMILFAPVSYVVWDNFEFTNLYWDYASPTNGSETYLSINGSAALDFIEVEHNYMHGWSHAVYARTGYNNPDVCDLLAGTTQGTDVGSSFHDNVVDGSDVSNGAGYSCAAIWGSPNIVYNNYLSHVANGFIGLASSQQEQWYQNTCDTMGVSYDLSPQHTQAYEENSSNGTLFYNNLIQHVLTGIVVNLGPAGTSKDYIWNNLIWDVTDNGNLIDCSYPASTSVGGSCYFFNNTIEAGVNGSTPSSNWINCLANLVACVFRNNHIISSTAQTCGVQPNCTQDHNLVQSQATANGQGYTGSQSPYVFFPTTGGSTIGVGSNLTSTTPGCGTSGLSSLCSDATYGVNYNATNHTVSAPNRTANSRGATWDIGAYQFAGGGGGGSGNALFSGRAILSGSLTVTTSGISAVTITTSASLPGCTVGIFCSATLSATGGAGGYVWSLLSGAFPANSNFSLSSGGVLSGVPTATASCSGCMTIQVCDSTLSNCASQAFSITISAGTLAFVNNSLATGTQGSVYSATALVSGGTLPYTACSVFSGSLPTGLSVAVTGSGINAGCLISGTLGGGATGTTFVLSVTDTAATTVHSASLSINVNIAGACGFPFFPCGNVSTTVNPLAQTSNTKPSCFDSPGTSGCKQPVPQLGFANALGQITITNPGVCTVLPTMSFSGGTSTRAGSVKGVWSGGSLIGWTYQDYGKYTVAPSITFSGGTCSTNPVATVVLQSASCGGHQCQGGLFGANSVVNGFTGGIVSNDPFYGAQRVLRLTDALTDPANPYVSYTNDSSAENSQTNFDGTIIKATAKGSWSDLFSFSPIIWNSAACAIGSTTCNAFQLQLVGKGGNFPSSFIFGQTNAAPASPADPTSDTYAFYAFDNCVTNGISTCAKIERWLICGPAGNTSTLCPSGWDAVIDPNWPTSGSSGYDVTQASCAGSTYMSPSVIGQGIYTPWTSFGNTAMNAADNRFVAELRLFNGLQDEAGTNVTVDTSTGTPRCKVVDLARGTASTDWNNSTQVAFSGPTCSAGKCNNVFNPLLPPAMASLSSGGTGSLNSAHTYAIGLSYTLRNSRGSAKSPGDQGETNGSAISTITGVTKIAIGPPGMPGDSGAGIAPVAGKNVPNSDCVHGAKAKICVLPTGYNVFICDRTNNPTCIPTRAQIDQAPTPVSSFTCTPASGNSGNVYGYLYSVTVRHSNGTNLDFGSQNITATCYTAKPINLSLPNSLSWAVPTISTSLVYDVDRGSSATVLMENLIGRIACPSSPCTLNDIGIGNVSAEEEMVSGATTSGVTISAVPANGALFPLPTLTNITSSAASWNQAAGTFYVALWMIDNGGLQYKSAEYGPLLFDASHTVHFNWSSLPANVNSYQFYWGLTPGGENQYFTIAGNSMGANSSFGGPGSGIPGTIPTSGPVSPMYTGLQGTGGASTHNVKLDFSGNPTIITPTAIANGLGYPVADWYIYLDSSAPCNANFQSCPFNVATTFYCGFSCTGHRATGNGGQIRDPGNTTPIQFMLMAPAEGQNAVSAVNDSPCASCGAIAQHNNWTFGIPSFTNYPLASMYTPVTAYGSLTWPSQLYTGEALFQPMGDSRVHSAINSISQVGTTVTAVLANTVGCQNNVYTICFAPTVQINTSSIPLGVSHSTNWNGQHVLTSVVPSTNTVTWTSGTSVTDSAGSGGTLTGCGGGAVLTGGALSNPSCFSIREGMIYSNGNEATRFYGTPRGFVSQAGATYPLIYESSAYTYWNEAATHFNMAPTALSRTSGTVTATFPSTSTLSANAKAISVTGKATGVNSTSFLGEFPIASTTGTTITWLQPGADDSVTVTAGTCNGSGTATCVDASDSYCFGSSLGDEYGAPDINMNVITEAGCRTDLMVIEPL